MASEKITAMIEDDKNYDDVITQLYATERSIASLSKIILQEYFAVLSDLFLRLCNIAARSVRTALSVSLFDHIRATFRAVMSSRTIP